jgi:signal peptidase II
MGVVRVNRFSRAIWLVIAVVVFAGDQVTKAVVEDLIPEHTTIPVFSHFLNLIHTRNPGAAFGLFSEAPAHWKTVLLIVVSSLLLAMVMAMIWRSGQLRWGMGVALALIFGGALSNLFDRIRFGRVVDFLDVYWRSYHWPTFNLADSAIVVGAGLLVFQLLFWEEPRRRNWKMETPK